MTRPSVRSAAQIVKNVHPILLARFCSRHKLLLCHARNDKKGMRLARITPALFLFAFFAVCVARGQIFTSSNVSAEATTSVQHASSIVELDDGSLLVSWYAG